MDILVEKEGAVAKVILNRPDARNALANTMRQDLVRIYDELNDDDSVRVIVLTGAGNAFCAGGDVKAMEKFTPQAGARTMAVSQNMALHLHKSDKPTIASVRGPAVGIGFCLALGCDMVVASDTARFGMVFKRIGLAPDGGGVFLLTQYLGVGKAKELVYTARILSGAEAHELGLVTRLVPDDKLEAETMALATELAESPPLAIQEAKKLFHSMYVPTMEMFMANEKLAQLALLQTEDHREGLNAFLEKRAPNFQGR